jgi:hypothetical protein
MGMASGEAIATMKNLFISAISENMVAVLPDHFAHVRNPLSSKN